MIRVKIVAENPNIKLDYSDSKGNLELFFEIPGKQKYILFLDYSFSEVTYDEDRNILFHLINPDIYFENEYDPTLFNDIDLVFKALSMSKLVKMKIEPHYCNFKFMSVILYNLHNGDGIKFDLSHLK